MNNQRKTILFAAIQLYISFGLAGDLEVLSIQPGAPLLASINAGALDNLSVQKTIPQLDARNLGTERKLAAALWGHPLSCGSVNTWAHDADDVYPHEDYLVVVHQECNARIFSATGEQKGKPILGVDRVIAAPSCIAVRHKKKSNTLYDLNGEPIKTLSDADWLRTGREYTLCRNDGTNTIQFLNSAGEKTVDVGYVLPEIFCFPAYALVSTPFSNTASKWPPLQSLLFFGPDGEQRAKLDGVKTVRPEADYAALEYPDGRVVTVSPQGTVMTQLVSEGEDRLQYLRTTPEYVLVNLVKERSNSNEATLYLPAGGVKTRFTPDGSCSRFCSGPSSFITACYDTAEIFDYQGTKLRKVDVSCNSISKIAMYDTYALISAGQSFFPCARVDILTPTGDTIASFRTDGIIPREKYLAVHDRSDGCTLFTANMFAAVGADSSKLSAGQLLLLKALTSSADPVTLEEGSKSYQEFIQLPNTVQKRVRKLGIVNPPED